MIIQIVDHLFIGDQPAAEVPPSEISAVLWAALDATITPPTDLVFARLPLREYTEPDPVDMEMGVDWLVRHLPNHQILVACRAGLGRSPSLIIAYLCCIQRWSFHEALSFVTQKHPGTTPLPRLAEVISQLTIKVPS